LVYIFCFGMSKTLATLATNPTLVNAPQHMYLLEVEVVFVQLLGSAPSGWAPPRIWWAAATARADGWSGSCCAVARSLPENEHDWLMDCLIDWVIDGLVGSLKDWLGHWLMDWLGHWLMDWLGYWKIDWLIDWVIERLIGWLIDLRIDWLI
jgi:hypothetical protein